MSHMTEKYYCDLLEIADCIFQYENLVADFTSRKTGYQDLTLPKKKTIKTQVTKL